TGRRTRPGPRSGHERRDPKQTQAPTETPGRGQGVATGPGAARGQCPKNQLGPALGQLSGPSPPSGEGKPAKTAGDALADDDDSDGYRHCPGVAQWIVDFAQERPTAQW